MQRLRRIFFCAAVATTGIFLRGAEPAPAAPVAPITTPAPTARVLRGLTYASPQGTELKLDLHLPLVTAEKPLPLVVWIHGGGWQEGSRGFCPMSPLVKDGYIVASISYRFTQVARFPAQIEDAKAAIRWLRVHAADYGIDARRIGVCGESAGGLLAALLGTSGDVAEVAGTEGDLEISSRVQAVVALCPPTDVTLDDAERALVPDLLKSADPKEVARGNAIRSCEKILTAALGGPLAEHRDLARKMSAVTYVTRDDPPFLLVHGDRDELVPISQSELLEAALKNAGVPVTLVVVPGAGHGFGRPKPELMAKIKAFFDAQL